MHSGPAANISGTEIKLTRIPVTHDHISLARTPENIQAVAQYQ